MEFLEKIKNKWQTVLVITVLVAAVVFSVSAFLPPQYGSKVSILVIQKQPSYDVDAFSAAKSAEYLSDILAKVIYSESFIQNVLESPYNAEIDFPLGDENRKEYWQKMIDVEQVNNTGIINITVYDRDRANAEKTAEAVSWAMIVRGHQYHGGGDRVQIEKIDGPITPENPMKPKILLNTLLGVILGFIGSVAVVYFFEDFELKIFGRKKRFEEIKNNNQDSDSKPFSSVNGVLNFREKHGDYASFDDYVFDKERTEKEREEKENEDYDKIIVDEKGDDSVEDLLEKGESESSEKKENVLVDDFVKNEKERRVIEIHEPNSLNGELTFEDVLVGNNQSVPDNIGSQTSSTPGNLPTFEGDMNSLIGGGDEAENVDKSEEKEYNRESTEDEVKERLNKLLRGDM